MIRRREFLNGLGAAAAWALAAHAQQPMPVIGFLGPGSAASDAYRVTAFRQGLNASGYVEGHYDRLPAAGKRSGASAHALGLEVHVLKASSEPDFDAAFANLIRLRAS